MTTQRTRQFDPAWFKSAGAREFMEWCFDRWEGDDSCALTSAEKQRYDGWIGEFILAALFTKFEDGPPMLSPRDYVQATMGELRRLQERDAS